MENKLPLNFTYGIEIEFEGICLDKINTILSNIGLTNWEVISDISVTNNNIGGEIVSGILSNDANDYYEIKTICKILKQNGAYISNFTGGHIHIGAHILGEEIENFKNMLKMWLAFENVIYRFSICDSEQLRAYYKESAYPYSINFFEKLIEINKINNFTDLFNYITKIKDSQIEYGINLNNLNLVNGVRKKTTINQGVILKDLLEKILVKEANKVKDQPTFNNEKSYRNTIEFTVFNSTLSGNILIENVKFLGYFFKYIISPEFDSKFIDSKLLSGQCNYYMEFNEDDAIILADLIFPSNEEKISFLKRCKVYQKTTNKRLK